jgi:gas vesicle protein
MNWKDRRSNMADNNSGVNNFGWFLAGLGIGALVGVLYAPKAGKETREDLVAGALDAKEKANAYAQQGVQKANEYYETGVARANEVYSQGVAKANDIVNQGKQAAGDYVDKGKEYYEKGRTQWSQYVDKGKDLIQNQKEAVQAGSDAYVEKTQEVAS